MVEQTRREVLIVGCGYVGSRLALREREEGARVRALARNAESQARLHALGVETVAGDLDNPVSLSALDVRGCELYYFAPPGNWRTRPRATGDARLAALAAIMQGANLPRGVVLISTTGVYGDCGGEWVNEERPTNPQTDRARRRLAAEATLREWSARSGVPAVILRVAGIYGPGKLPEARLRAGEPVLRESQSPWSNRIHVDDLVTTCIAAMRRGESGIYNATDGHPTTMTDFFNRVADTLGLPRPEQISADEARERLSEGMLSYLAESKRLDNRRMREELGVTLRYPDLANGLAACCERPGHEPPRQL